MQKRGSLAVLVLLVLTYSVFSFNLDFNKNFIGQEKKLKLLAVQETEKGYNGSLADLYLKINEGSSGVFLATFPFTKLDTQISTRYAKEIACNYFKLDCSQYDFLYTIKASSNIVGGPSAGAAISALTSIALLDLKYDEKTTITGTINSGGIIGPVGGVKEKLEAASKNGVKKVLIAQGSALVKEKNETLDLIKFAKENLSLEVKEIGNLGEAVFELTGKNLKENNISLAINPAYQEIMKELADLLCSRTRELERGLKIFELPFNETKDIEEKKNESRLALERSDYYSAASFCFGTNVLIKKLTYDKKEVGVNWVKAEQEKLNKKVELLENKLKEEKTTTISDLQAMMVVKERLSEVKDLIKNSNETEKDRNYLLAYAEERYHSALSWMYFFKMEGKAFSLDKEKLKASCQEKISESEERIQYAELSFAGFDMSGIKKKIENAKKSSETSDYELCLSHASEAKGEANAFLSTIGVSDDNVDGYLESKFKAVKTVIAENSAEGVFPILGYSYYEYARSLKDSSNKEGKYSALLYLEYALELSNLDIYFNEEKQNTFLLNKPSFGTGSKLNTFPQEPNFGWGLVIGVIVTLLVVFWRDLIINKKKKKK